MIWQLMKRDPVWKAMPWCALGSLIVWPCPNPVGPFGILCVLAGLLAGDPTRRATRFEAGLPIGGRDLTAGRILSLMAAVWVPGITGAAGIAAVRGLSAHVFTPLAAAAVCTLVAGVAQSPRIAALSAPRWMAYPLFLLMPPSGSYLADYAARTPLGPVCALAGIALLARVWATVPQSLQLAPIEAAGAETQEPAFPAAGKRAALGWMPLVRSVYRWQYVFFVTMTAFTAASGSWLLNCFWLLFAWQVPRTNARWLWALPVGFRTLLWMIVGPMFAAHILGYAGALLRFGPRFADPRVLTVTLGAMLAWLMLSVLLYCLIDWRRLTLVSRWVRWAVISLLYVGWAIAVFSPLPMDGRSLWEALARFAGAVPLNLPALIAATAAVLIVLYGAVEKLFREQEFTAK